MDQERLPLRVCFIAPKAYPLFNPEIKKVFGGAELDFYILACELAKDADYQVSFVTADYGQRDQEVIQGVRIFKSLQLEESMVSGAWRIWQALRKAGAQVYLQESASPGTFLVAFFCKCYSRQFIYRTAHQEECDGTYLRQKIFAGKGFRWALRHADHVIVQNDQDAGQLHDTIGVDSQVIRNAHVLPTVNTDPREFIFWAGRSVSFKRPRLFLKLAQCNPNERFVMVCQQATHDHDYDDLKAEAETISNLEFIPRVPFSTIGDYFSRAKVYVNTSESEGFANTFVDACKAGTPILSLTVNPDNFIGKHRCGFCAQGQWERFVQAFERMCIDSQYTGDLGTNARKYAEEYHDITKVIRTYKEVFEKVSNQGLVDLR